MRDFIDDLLAPDDSESEVSPYTGGATIGIALTEPQHCKNSAESEAIEKRMIASHVEIEFREPDCLTIADYERAKAAGLLSAEDEILVLADLATRIVHR
jgi:hypothetical protein